MANIFQIEQKMLALLDDNVDLETGEIIEDENSFLDLYNSIELELSTKLDNSCSIIKVINNETELIDKEIERLEKLKKSNSSKLNWIKNSIDLFLKKQVMKEDGTYDVVELNKFAKSLKLPHNNISYRKSESLEILPSAIIPSEFIKTEIVEKPKKAEIKKELKSGAIIEGCSLITNANIQLK